ncbi:alginate lyase family protein [Methylocaldum sp.]|uniref:heparinase II/III family protein n=1 Tax=Methylocaldum sp. TaxID=1969727 RepID=UPI002D305899|nr:alginate lyase family protein [Methylocaldum sp.]HYE36644.1 alginate lyase family protein [Methylocaldum sp.]
MSASLAWKFSRLKTMGPMEVLWRVRQAVSVRLEAYGVGLAQPVVQEWDVTGTSWVAPLPTCIPADPYVQASEKILAGRWKVFALHACDQGFPPCWNRDPKTCTEAPLVFGKLIDYRDEQVVGDIKYLWEPNRHLELVTLAQAWHLTRESRYLAGACELLESWFDQCPYPLGPNWTSSLELAVRLVNWATAWHLLGGDASSLFEGEAGQSFRTRWLESIFCHCHFIANHLSRHSSANNHLYGELMGLFVASVTWPLWSESARWRTGAHLELEEQALIQNTPDGVNREQAFYYQHEFADMMLLVWRYGEANGIEFSDAFKHRLESLLEFFAAVMDTGGNVPMVGDADDALMIRFDPSADFSVYRSLLATGAVLFDRSDFAQKARRLDDKTLWLLGEEAIPKFASLLEQNVEAAQRRAFPDGGYWILGDAFDTPDEIRVVVDAGPLGYLSIAAHGHADALAFTLSIGGHEFLVDPGTYAYHTQKAWRDYFRGTSAHNTIRVDGVNQSIIGGNFMWLDKANAWCERFDTNPEEDVFVGAHDGYLRLSDPVAHRREIRLNKHERLFRVVDILECRGSHDVELFWHFGENCEVELTNRTTCASNSGYRLHMHFDPVVETTTLFRGNEILPAGWISRHMDEKTPTTTVRHAVKITGMARIITDISLSKTAT